MYKSLYENEVCPLTKTITMSGTRVDYCDRERADWLRVGYYQPSSSPDTDRQIVFHKILCFLTIGNPIILFHLKKTVGFDRFLQTGPLHIFKREYTKLFPQLKKNVPVFIVSQLNRKNVSICIYMTRLLT